MIVLALSFIMSVECSECKFSENAQDLLTVNFNDKLDSVEVFINAEELFEDYSRSCKEDLKLLVRADNEESERDLGTGKCPRDVCRWYVRDIKPCLANQFTLQHGSQALEKTLQAKSTSALVDALYTELAEVSNIALTDENILRWKKVTCATGYQVNIYNEDSDIDVADITVNTNQLDVSDLDLMSCVNYQATVTPFISEPSSTYSKYENYKGFKISPSKDIFKRPSIHTQRAGNSAVVTWLATPCVEAHEVTLCKEGSAECDSRTIDRGNLLDADNKVSQVKYTAENLDECFNYAIKINPQTKSEYSRHIVTWNTTLSAKLENNENMNIER